jgi:hypothetical protein
MKQKKKAPAKPNAPTPPRLSATQHHFVLEEIHSIPAKNMLIIWNFLNYIYNALVLYLASQVY